MHPARLPYSTHPGQPLRATIPAGVMHRERRHSETYSRAVERALAPRAHADLARDPLLPDTPQLGRPPRHIQRYEFRTHRIKGGRAAPGSPSKQPSPPASQASANPHDVRQARRPHHARPPPSCGRHTCAPRGPAVGRAVLQQHRGRQLCRRHGPPRPARHRRPGRHRPHRARLQPHQRHRRRVRIRVQRHDRLLHQQRGWRHRHRLRARLALSSCALKLC